jgi:hypothetical protein
MVPHSVPDNSIGYPTLLQTKQYGTRICPYQHHKVHNSVPFNNTGYPNPFCQHSTIHHYVPVNTVRYTKLFLSKPYPNLCHCVSINTVRYTIQFLSTPSGIPFCSCQHRMLHQSVPFNTVGYPTPVPVNTAWYPSFFLSTPYSTQLPSCQQHCLRYHTLLVKTVRYNTLFLSTP